MRMKFSFKHHRTVCRAPCAPAHPRLWSAGVTVRDRCYWKVASSAESEATTAVKTTQQNATTEVQQVYTLGMDSPDLAVQEGQHIECVATGMDVQCFITDDDEDASSKQQTAGVKNGAPSTATISNGSMNAANKQQSKQQQQQQQQLEQPAVAPATAAAGAFSGDAGPLQQLLSVALLVSPFFFWGTSMVAMKPVTAHTTPLLLGAMRLLPAGLALVGWSVANGRPQPKSAAAWAWVLAFGLVDGAAFQGFLAEGLERTSAGLGSVIIDSQPLTVAVLAAVLFGEALSGVGVAGLLIGVIGLLLLEVPPDMLSQGLSSAGVALSDPVGDVESLAAAAAAVAASSNSSGGGSLLDSGEFWMLLAAQSMAVGTVMVRWVTKHCDPVAATAWHMVLGGLILGAAAVAVDGDQGELAGKLQQFNGQDALAMAYTSLLGGAASYGIFFYEATHGSLTAISSLTFLTPMFAAGTGFLVLGERLSPLQLFGAAVTLAAVFMINTPASHKQQPSPTKER